jgi:hypothetical protein
MLKALHPLLGPDLLHALASMGHGDEIAIVDANFPAASHLRGGARLIRLDGATMPQTLAAVLTLLPLDHFVDAPLATMAVVGDRADDPQQLGGGDVVGPAPPANGAGTTRRAPEHDRHVEISHAIPSIVNLVYKVTQQCLGRDDLSPSHR